jgi:hypothetical protein
MTEQEKKKWSNNKNLTLNVQKEYFHHHSYEIIKAHPEIKAGFLEALNNQIKISPRIKQNQGVQKKGIKADELNKEIRILLSAKPNKGLKFEVFEDNGVFYFSEEKSSIGGFDFAILNHVNNIIALRNLCFGSLQYADGEKRWSKFLEKNPDLAAMAKELERPDAKGINLEKQDKIKSQPLIVGEIQFGNWALAYRDFFKVLKADVQNSIDCLIYVVPTGKLESLLSDGIVTFDKTKKIIDDFSKVISVPVWLVGLDIVEDI